MIDLGQLDLLPVFSCFLLVILPSSSLSLGPKRPTPKDEPEEVDSRITLPLVSSFLPMTDVGRSLERGKKEGSRIYSPAHQKLGRCRGGSSSQFSPTSGVAVPSPFCSPWVVLASSSCPPLPPHSAPQQQICPLQSPTWGGGLFLARTGVGDEEDELYNLQDLAFFSCRPNSTSQAVLWSSPLQGCGDGGRTQRHHLPLPDMGECSQERRMDGPSSSLLPQEAM